MKKILIFIFIATSLLSSKSLNIVTSNWEPYVYDNNQGLVNRLIQMIFFDSGLNYQLKYTPFNKGYEKVIDKSIDGTFPFFLDEERKSNTVYSLPILKVSHILFYNRKVYDKSFKLKSLKLGIVSNYIYNGTDKLFQNNNISLFQNELLGFEALNKGKIDFFLAEKNIGINIIQNYYNNYYSSLVYLEKPVFHDTLHILLSKKKENYKIIKKINDSIEKLTKEGMIKTEILKHNKLLNKNIFDIITLNTSSTSNPLVIGKEVENLKNEYLIPNGTKAIVLKWSKHFINPGRINMYKESLEETKVKIIEGPLKGKILFIQNVYINAP